MFKFKEIQNGKILYSDLIPELQHFFTTRATSINTEEQKKFVCEYLGLEEKNLIHPTQTHSANVEFATENKSDYPDTDGLILTNKGQAVYLRFADCTPVILYDKKANTGAIAHAGWKGTVGKIAPKTAQKMLEYTGSDISDIYAVIGPAIDTCCYEVGENVLNGIKSSVTNIDGLITDSKYVNLKMTNARQLTELGVPKANIDICPYCTSCRNDLFYSYRKENGTQLRHNAVIMLK